MLVVFCFFRMSTYLSPVARFRADRFVFVDIFINFSTISGVGQQAHENSEKIYPRLFRSLETTAPPSIRRWSCEQHKMFALCRN